MADSVLNCPACRGFNQHNCTHGRPKVTDPAQHAASLREHLIAEHGYTADYFDEDYPVGGPIHDLEALRWLHAPHVKTREYPNGCERL
jgi:hypothetical protein